MYYVISKVFEIVNTFHRYFLNKSKKNVEIYTSKMDAIKTSTTPIAKKTTYLTISNLIFFLSCSIIDLTKLLPATNTRNIEATYIILWSNIELQMKIMAVLVLCVA